MLEETAARIALRCHPTLLADHIKNQAHRHTFKLRITKHICRKELEIAFHIAFDHLKSLNTLINLVSLRSSKARHFNLDRPVASSLPIASTSSTSPIRSLRTVLPSFTSSAVVSATLASGETRRLSGRGALSHSV